MTSLIQPLRHVVPVMAILFMAAGTVYFFVLDGGREPRPFPQASRGAPVVHSTVYPLLDFAQRLAGARIEAACIMPPGADPLHWQPDEAAIKRLQRADLLLFNGAGIDSWAVPLALSPARTVATAGDLGDDFMTLGPAFTHSHGPGGTHTHQGTNLYTWLDPRLAVVQAEQVASGLRRVLGGDPTELDASLRRLTADLAALHHQFTALGPVPAGEVLVFSHPAYHYLRRRYDWPAISLDADPGEPLSTEALVDARRRLAGHRARFILWPREPADALADQVRDELGLVGIVFATCASPPDPAGAGYIEAMQDNIRRLGAAFGR